MCISRFSSLRPPRALLTYFEPSDFNEALFWAEQRPPILADPTHRTNTYRLQQEMQALPTVGHAVGLLEQLARDRQPIFA